MISIYLILLICLESFGLSEYNKLEFLEKKSENYYENLIESRMKRQAQGTVMCVPSGTCITNSTTPGPTPTPSPIPGTGVEPRIVTGTNPVTLAPSPNPSTCPIGQTPCVPVSTSPLCGQRYVQVNTTPGPTTDGAYPWAVYIKNQTNMFTGSGVLLDSNTVLTVAHKVVSNIAAPNYIQVYMGVYNPTTLGTSEMRTASQIILHPSSNFLINGVPNPNPDYKNNLAIIKLNSPVLLGYRKNIGTACLPPPGANYVGNPNCFVSGWGQTSFQRFDAPTAQQKQVNVPILSYADCRDRLSKILTNVDFFLDPQGELCAGGKENEDACQQDGGGPLVCLDSATGRFNVVGLVNWGKGCGRAGIPGVYVNVSPYLQWIQQYLSPMVG